MVSIQLSAAYAALGIADPAVRQDMVRSAIDYLGTDREHYIVVSEFCDPEDIDDEQGIICRIVPLAQRTTTNQNKSYSSITTSTLCLMVTDNRCNFVIRTEKKYNHKKPRYESFSYPVYYRVGLSELSDDLQCLPPEQLIPPATAQEREVFGMLLMGIAKVACTRQISQLCLKAEQLMEELKHVPDTEITIEKQRLRGRQLVLASELDINVRHEKNRRHSYQRALLLFVTKDSENYVLMTQDICEYYKEDTEETVYLEPYRTRRKVTYCYTDPSDIDFPLHVNY